MLLSSTHPPREKVVLEKIPKMNPTRGLDTNDVVAKRDQNWSDFYSGLNVSDTVLHFIDLLP